MPVLDRQTITTIARVTDFKVIADVVKSGECILFLGSGAHFPSEKYNYPGSECPPLGGSLSRELAGDCGFCKRFPGEAATNLQRVSLCYEIEHSRAALVAKIRSAVHVGKRPSPALRALAELPFRLIITTNYDQLFERALREAKKEPRVGVYNPDEYTVTADYKKPTAEEPFVFKIHGDVSKPESIIITDEDYIQFVLRMSDKDVFHPVPHTFRYNFTRWPTIFVGYSLLDYNLRLLFKSLRWRLDDSQIPDTYSVDPSPDPLIFDVWHNRNKYVTFIAQDVWAFVPELYREVKGEEMPA